VLLFTRLGVGIKLRSNLRGIVSLEICNGIFVG
jgi:hypothetical protein